MIKVTSLKRTDGNNYKVQAFADTKDEVTNDAEIIGMPVGGFIDMGSAIVTADGDVALRKSDGTWNWLK